MEREPNSSLANTQQSKILIGDITFHLALIYRSLFEVDISIISLSLLRRANPSHTDRPRTNANAPLKVLPIFLARTKSELAPLVPLRPLCARADGYIHPPIDITPFPLPLPPLPATTANRPRPPSSLWQGQEKSEPRASARRALSSHAAAANFSPLFVLGDDERPK